MFTYEAYRQMLFAFQSAGYKFLGYSEIADPPVVWLRHDVDVDLGFCLKIAAIEADLGIKSTFCIMVRSDAYNILSPTTERKVRQLTDLDHRIGLHFDCSLYSPETGHNHVLLRQQVVSEAAILSDVAGKDVELVSFHKPSSLVLAGDTGVTSPLPHAYAAKFMRESQYFADSGGWFRYGWPTESKAFKERKSITLNCHPLWWSAQARSPLYALKEVVAQQREVVRQYLLDNVVGV